jgi:hypothetical protein
MTSSPCQFSIRLIDSLPLIPNAATILSPIARHEVTASSCGRSHPIFCASRAAGEIHSRDGLYCRATRVHSVGLAESAVTATVDAFLTITATRKLGSVTRRILEATVHCIPSRQLAPWFDHD